MHISVYQYYLVFSIVCRIHSLWVCVQSRSWICEWCTRYIYVCIWEILSLLSDWLSIGGGYCDTLIIFWIFWKYYFIQLFKFLQFLQSQYNAPCNFLLIVGVVYCLSRQKEQEPNGGWSPTRLPQSHSL